MPGFVVLPRPVLRIAYAGAAIFLLSMDTSRANLGDTEAQCVSRYGAEVSTQDDVGYRQVGDKAVTFRWKKGDDTYDVRVTFLHGTSCHEKVSNDDSSRGLTEAQMKALLTAQSAGLEWQKGKRVFRTTGIDSGTTYGREDWQRSDGATAILYLTGQADARTYTGELEVSTKLYTDAQREYDKENGDQ